MMELPELPKPEAKCWDCGNYDDYGEFYTADQMRAYAAAAVEAERERWKILRDTLQSDIKRPEGRWGMHGMNSVDDDYFLALEYVAVRMSELLQAKA